MVAGLCYNRNATGSVCHCTFTNTIMTIITELEKVRDECVDTSSMSPVTFMTPRHLCQIAHLGTSLSQGC